MNKEFLDYIYAISLLIGIFGGLFYGTQFLVKNFKTSQKKKRSNWKMDKRRSCRG